MPPIPKSAIAAAGAAIGYAIYRFVGCKTGACPLSPLGRKGGLEPGQVEVCILTMILYG